MPSRFALALALLVGAPLAVSAATARRSECRRQCDGAVQSCVTTTGARTRACRRHVLRQCRREGLGVCATPSTVPSASSTTTSTTLPATAPGLPFVDRLGGPGAEMPRALALGPDGGIVVTGSFEGTSLLGGPPLVSTGGTSDAFLARYSPGGVHQWSRRDGGTGEEQPNAVAVDGAGNVAIAGTYLGTALLGGLALPAVGSRDVFVARYSATGTALWARTFGGLADDVATGVGTEPGGDVVIAGYFHRGIVLDGIPLVALSGGDNVFVARLAAADGHVLWARGFAGTSDGRAWGMAVDSVGNVIVTGAFSGGMNFGAGYTYASGAAYQDAFLAKLAGDDGHTLWARCLGGPANDLGEAVAVDGAGGVAVAGRFEGTSDWGTGRLVSAGGYDIVVARYRASDGASLWVRRLGGMYEDDGLAVAADAAGNIVCTGWFSGTMTTDAGPLASEGGSDVVVAKLAAVNGALAWVRGFGGPSADIGHAVAVDRDGSALVLGDFWQTADFGTTRLTSAGSVDAFLVRIAP